MKFPVLRFIFFGVLLFSGLLYGAKTPDASKTFDKAVGYYQVGKYDSTITVLRSFLKKNGKHPLSEKMVPLIIEAMVREKDFTSVHRLFLVYRRKFPQSSYLPRLWYNEGLALVNEEQFLEAIDAFSRALSEGVNTELDSLVMSNVEMICEDALSEEELSILGKRSSHPWISEIVNYHEIKKSYVNGQYGKARNDGERFLRTYSRSQYESSVRDILNHSKNQQSDFVQIGVLVPLSGEYADIGKRAIQGIQMAVDGHNAGNGRKVKLIVSDTRGDLLETVRKVREMVDEHNISIFIGPLLSHTATVSAAMLSERNAIMISPTATDDGIADLGKNIFQLNVTLGMLAQRLANYAIKTLNVKDFAILAPRTPYGTLLSKSFKEQLRMHNVELLAEEYFEEGANDFRDQFMDIREKLLQRKLEKLSLEKGINYTPGKPIPSHYKRRYADSTLSVGGLFMPAEYEDVVMLAPQTTFHRIQTQMLGSSGWYTPKTILDGQKYVRNAIISTTTEPSKDLEGWSEFKDNYKAKYNVLPDRVTALGFDATKLMCSVVAKKGGHNVAEMSRALSETKGYQGFSGLISFDNKRGINTEAVIMKVTSGGFIRVQ